MQNIDWNLLSQIQFYGTTEFKTYGDSKSARSRIPRGLKAKTCSTIPDMCLMASILKKWLLLIYKYHTFQNALKYVAFHQMK